MRIDFKWLEEKIFLHALSEQEQTALQSLITIEHFAKGDVIIMQQEAKGKLYLLKSGRVDVVLDFNGENTKLTERGEGAYLGDMSFIDDSEASASVIAKGDCEAYSLQRDALLASDEGVAKDLMFGMMKNMRANLHEMTDTNVNYKQYIQGRKY